MIHIHMLLPLQVSEEYNLSLPKKSRRLRFFPQKTGAWIVMTGMSPWSCFTVTSAADRVERIAVAFLPVFERVWKVLCFFC